MSEPNLAPNECECNELRFLREHYHNGYFIDPDWSKATCGECGYWTKYQKGAIEARYESWCRKINAIQVDKDTPACPSFVRRPKEEAPHDNP